MQTPVFRPARVLNRIRDSQAPPQSSEPIWKGRKLCQTNRNQLKPPLRRRHTPRKPPAPQPHPHQHPPLQRTAPKVAVPLVVRVGTPTPARAAKVVRVVAAVKAVPVVPVVDPAARAAASASISAKRKSASSVSRRWTSSTTSAPTFFPNSSRSAAKFFRAA